VTARSYTSPEAFKQALEQRCYRSAGVPISGVARELVTIIRCRPPRHRR
jgi:hypothetical protein